MSYTMEDFRRDYVKEHLKDLTVQERLAGVPKDEVFEAYSPDEIEKYLKRRKRQPMPRKSKKQK